MGTTRQLAAKGLFYIFAGTIITIGSVIPYIGGLFAAGGGVLALYGIYVASKVHRNYKSALYADVFSIVTNILMLIFSFGVIHTALDILDSIFGLSAVYFICMATAEILSGVSTKLIIWANRVWMIHLFCTIISVVGLVTAVFAPSIAGIISTVAALLFVIAVVTYLIFLYRAQLVLKNA